MRSIIFAAVVSGFFLIAGGCDRPESTPEELGTVVETLPELADRPDSLPIPEGADENCSYKMRQEMMKQMEASAEEGANK